MHSISICTSIMLWECQAIFACPGLWRKEGKKQSWENKDLLLSWSVEKTCFGVPVLIRTKKKMITQFVIRKQEHL